MSGIQVFVGRSGRCGYWLEMGLQGCEGVSPLLIHLKGHDQHSCNKRHINKRKTDTFINVCSAYYIGEPSKEGNSKRWLRNLACVALSTKNNKWMEKWQDKEKQLGASQSRKLWNVNAWEETNGVRFVCRFLCCHLWADELSTVKENLYSVFRQKRGKAS